MPSGFKISLVAGFVAVVGLTLWMLSRPSDSEKQDLPFDASAQKSAHASDLAEAAGNPKPKAAEPARPNRTRRNTPANAQPPRNNRPTQPRTGRPSTGLTEPTPARPTTPQRRTLPPRATLPDPAREMPTQTPTDIGQRPTPPPSRPATTPGDSTPSPRTIPTAPTERPTTTPPVTEPRSTPPTATPADAERPTADPAPTARTTPIPEPPARRDEPIRPRQEEESRPTPPSTRRGGEQIHEIAAGESLIAIAGRYYDDDRLWKAILMANEGVDPKRLLVGKELRIPSEADARDMLKQQRVRERPVPAPEPTEHSTYVVEPGDSLSAIARKALDDVGRWKEIFELNRDKLKDPDDIKAGMKLKLPKK